MNNAYYEACSLLTEENPKTSHRKKLNVLVTKKTFLPKFAFPEEYPSHSPIIKNPFIDKNIQKQIREEHSGEKCGSLIVS